MRSWNVLEIRPGMYSFSDVNERSFSNIQSCDASSAADNPVRTLLYCHFVCLNLKRLFCLWCRYQCTGHNDRCSDILSGDLIKILHFVMIYHLQRLKIRTVIYHDKSKCLGIANTADPSPTVTFLSRYCSLFLNNSRTVTNSIPLTPSFQICLCRKTDIQ